MLDQKEYQSAFCHVRASDSTREQVLQMQRRFAPKPIRRIGRLVLIAAMIGAMLAISAVATPGYPVMEDSAQVIEYLFGENGRAHVEPQMWTEDKGEYGVHEYWTPSVDRVPVDEEVAQRLVAPYLYEVGESFTYQDYTVTVVAYAIDTATRTGVMYYTVDYPQGFTGCNARYDGELSVQNEKMPSCIQISREYLIPAETTETRIAVAAYLDIVHSGEGLHLRFYDDRKGGLKLPLNMDAEPMAHVTLADGQIIVSPIALKIEDSYFPPHDDVVDTLTLYFSDGSQYTALSEGQRNLVTAASNDVGEVEPYSVYGFNRIVDVEKLTAVEINGQLWQVS